MPLLGRRGPVVCDAAAGQGSTPSSKRHGGVFCAGPALCTPPTPPGAEWRPEQAGPAAGCECAGSLMGPSLGVGGPRGRSGTGGAGWETGRANCGSPLPRAPRWAAGLRRGYSLLQSRATILPPPQRNLFPASQIRELARERQPHSTPLTPPSPVQALGLGASTAEYTWHWHVTLGTPGPQSCCEEGVGCRFRQSQPGLRKELFSFLLVLSDLLV